MMQQKDNRFQQMNQIGIELRHLMHAEKIEDGDDDYDDDRFGSNGQNDEGPDYMFPDDGENAFTSLPSGM